MSLDSPSSDNATTIQQIISLFNNLSTNSARRAAYHELLNQLNSTEWCDLRACIKQRTFQKDILGESLPEIALQIVQHLSVSDLHVLRRVSRRWHALLSSASTKRTVYRQWTNNSSTHLTTTEITRYAQRRLYLERGQPVAAAAAQRAVKVIDGQPNPHSAPTPNTFAYAHGRFAWLRSPDLLVVHSIRNSTRQQFCTENRDRFRLVGISNSVVVATSTRAYCHVWDLETEEHAWFRIPSLNVTGFAVRDNTVAVAYNSYTVTESGDKIDTEFVTYWDMWSRTAHTIENVPQVAVLDLLPATKTLVVVHIELLETYRVCIRKYSMDGEGHAHTQRAFPLSAVHRDWSLEMLSRSWDNNHYRFAVFFVQSPLNGAVTRSFQWIIATYDPQTDEISLHEFTWDDRPYHFLNAAAVDHNLLYYLREDGGRPALWVSNTSAQPPHRAARGMDPSCHDADAFFLGDREFVLQVHQTETRAWPVEDATLAHAEFTDDS
ncbi:F-box domain protein [Aspergillus brunneoviolaceus CBS 621.78]|uniref:Uncharacterized protein n=1 Tax=Aspergillus brunneoviolaceus CBS 621.78 TaxID=1450534 RepID=A0ACD1FSU6_9EURO|nr:hypothetical protein BO95DRAFT_376498 [Aspergillus brunneoviolaceus CBS 621.78]RAH40056.1 hypothetical protein BO95DRAFT_376498 [Aspergillus brunneoviolaceus CBS 621.78]